METDWKKKYEDAMARMELCERTGLEKKSDYIFPELRESEDERMAKRLIHLIHTGGYLEEPIRTQILAWLEKQKENPKSADSIPSDCVSDVKCEDRWHKVNDSLPDNGRLVLANDCLGNVLLARYDGEGNWEVSVYDNDDYYCRNTITKWCDIPSEKQKEQKPAEWSEEDKHKLNRIYEILGYAADDKGFLTSKRIIGDKEAIELQDFLRSIAKPQIPEWSEEEAPDETKQEWGSVDIPGSIKTSRIETLKNIISYFKYERKATQEEIRISFIPCLENLLEEIEQKPAEWSEEDEKILNLAIEWAETMSGQFSFVDMNPTDFRKIIAWLKSLKNSGNFPKSNTNSSIKEGQR